MLEEKEVKTAKSKLLAEEKKLIKELSNFADRRGKGDYSTRYVDFGDDEDDNVEEYRQYDFNLSLERELEEQLDYVRSGLKKIEKGKYGICEKCGGDINPKRLEAYPAAPFCMKCSNESK